MSINRAVRDDAWEALLGASGQSIGTRLPPNILAQRRAEPDRGSIRRAESPPSEFRDRPVRPLRHLSCAIRGGPVTLADSASSPAPDERDPSRRPRSKSRRVRWSARREQPAHQFGSLSKPPLLGRSCRDEFRLDRFQHPRQRHRERNEGSVQIGGGH
jgi:hypothetical protein